MGKLTLIAAIGEGNALGKDNELLWHLPDDFRRFKRLTSGHPIIMGRKTFESFPKPLPDRRHIVITRNRNYRTKFKDIRIVHNLEDALALVADEALSYIIGGGEIYTLAMAYADTLEITRVHGTFEGDAYFPTIDESMWEIERTDYHAADEKHPYAFTYITYSRRPERPFPKSLHAPS